MIGAVGDNQMVFQELIGCENHDDCGGTPESAAIASYAYALEQRIQTIK